MVGTSATRLAGLAGSARCARRRLEIVRMTGGFGHGLLGFWTWFEVNRKSREYFAADLDSKRRELND